MMKKIRFRFLYVIAISILVLFLYLKKKNAAPKELFLRIVSDTLVLVEQDSVSIPQLSEKLVEAGVGQKTKIVISASGSTSMSTVQTVQTHIDSLNPYSVLYELEPEK